MINYKRSHSYTYNNKNQFVKYQESDKTVEFKYDPFGRRIAKQVRLSNSQTPQLTSYYYEGYRVIEERDGSDNLKKQYIYGAGIDEILRMDIFENGTAKPYYFHHNLIGSITGITDNTGNIVELVEYDPYGKSYFLKPTGNPENPYELSETSTLGNNYLFQGREYDPETGLYYFRARYYDPILSRFLSPDPTGYVDSMNLYQAFNMSPINFIDPRGEFTIRIVEADIIPSPYDHSRLSLFFGFKFEFTSKEEIGKDVFKNILQLLAQEAFAGVGWILQVQELFQKAHLMEELYGQGATIINPVRDDPSNFQNWLTLLKNKVREIETDPRLRKLYEEMYGRKEYLTTEETIEFLKAAREELGEWKNIYPWLDLPELAVAKWESSWLGLKAWLGSGRFGYGPLGRNYDKLQDEYIKYYLKPYYEQLYGEPITISYKPTLEELYKFLKKYWQSQLWIMQGR